MDRLSEGTLHIGRHDDVVLREVLGAFGTAAGAHPAWAVVGPFRGLGGGVRALFDLVGAEVDDGVMFGETRVEVLRPLDLDADYGVRCTLVDSRRRSGRSVGEFDLVRILTEIHDEDGVLVRTHDSLIVPRDRPRTDDAESR